MTVVRDKPRLEFLEHHGVKGMKWGVRRAYTDRVSSEAARARRVGEGGGSKLDKLKVHSETSVLSAAKAGGYKKAALVRADSLQQHADRINNGEASLHDVLRAAGHLRTSDLLNAKISKG